MQDVEHCLNFTFLPVASNDNDDLLSFDYPSVDLAFIRELKSDLREENAETGMLLCSRKERRFFQEIADAERYIVLRYFTPAAPKHVLRDLKRRILDSYLAPKRRKRKKSEPKPH